MRSKGNGLNKPFLFQKFGTKIQPVEPKSSAKFSAAFCVKDFLSFNVGVKGLEPSTPASQTQCSSQLSYTPIPVPGGRIELPTRGFSTLA